MDYNKKIRQFHALLYQTQMTKHKQDILANYNVDSTKELTPDELDEVIAMLKEIEAEKQADKTAEIRHWRHNVLRKVSDCGVNTNDWSAVNAFMLNPRISGKHLYCHTVDELKNLHRKLHNVATAKAKQRQRELIKAALN